jgi:hypothetical protein
MIMDILWGILIGVIGLFLGISGLMKSDFIVYKIFTSRSKVLWKGNVHAFYVIVGVLLIIFGILVAVDVI